MKGGRAWSATEPLGPGHQCIWHFQLRIGVGHAVRAHYLGLSAERAMGYHMGKAGMVCLSMGTEALFGQ